MASEANFLVEIVTKLEKELSVADPGFPVGGGGGRGLPRRLRFADFVCQNERIWTLRGRAPGTPPRSTNGYISS